MIQKDLNHLRDTILKGIYNYKDVIWQNAFLEYNGDKKTRLSMKCGSCYRKVLQYVTDKHKKVENRN